MAVTLNEVQHMAALARLAVDEERARGLADELTSILRHMEVLRAVDTGGVQAVDGVGAAGLPLRPDEGPPLALARSREEFAPCIRDGFFIVPRLATHDPLDASS